MSALDDAFEVLGSNANAETKMARLEALWRKAPKSEKGKIAFLMEGVFVEEHGSEIPAD